MDVFLHSLAQRGPAFQPIYWAALVLLSIAVIVLARLHVRAQRRWGSLLRGANGASLEAVLESHLAERTHLLAEVHALVARTQALEEGAKSAKRHIGLVRFDAFEDVGGSQSFAMAILDERGDGAVLSSIVGRNSCRVYAKPMVGGRSERELSGEEQRAVREAVSSAPRSLVSA